MKTSTYEPSLNKGLNIIESIVPFYLYNKDNI